jgi:hypothetical protein
MFGFDGTLGRWMGLGLEQFESLIFHVQEPDDIFAIKKGNTLFMCVYIYIYIFVFRCEGLRYHGTVKLTLQTVQTHLYNPTRWEARIRAPHARGHVHVVTASMHVFEHVHVVITNMLIVTASMHVFLHESRSSPIHSLSVLFQLQ